MSSYDLIEAYQQDASIHVLNADELVAYYVELRESLTEERHAFEAVEAAVKDTFKEIEEKLRVIADSAGLKSLPTQHGTAYRSTETHVSAPAETWDKFVDYVRENDAFELIQKRVSKLAVLELLEHSNLAPEDIGLSVTSLPVINIRKS